MGHHQTGYDMKILVQSYLVHFVTSVTAGLYQSWSKTICLNTTRLELVNKLALKIFLSTFDLVTDTGNVS